MDFEQHRANRYHLLVLAVQEANLNLTCQEGIDLLYYWKEDDQPRLREVIEQIIESDSRYQKILASREQDSDSEIKETIRHETS